MPLVPVVVTSHSTRPRSSVTTPLSTITIVKQHQHTSTTRRHQPMVPRRWWIGGDGDGPTHFFCVRKNTQSGAHYPVTSHTPPTTAPSANAWLSVCLSLLSLSLWTNKEHDGIGSSDGIPGPMVSPHPCRKWARRGSELQTFPPAVRVRHCRRHGLEGSSVFLRNCGCLG